MFILWIKQCFINVSAPAVGLVSSTSSPLSGFHSTVTARCEDDRKYLKIALENTSLDNAETSTSSCRADSITEPKIKSNSGNSNSDYSFGWLVPLSTSTSPGENTISNGINKPTPPAYRTSESPSCAVNVTDETDTLPKTESSLSTAFKDRSSLDINEYDLFQFEKTNFVLKYYEYYFQDSSKTRQVLLERRYKQ